MTRTVRIRHLIGEGIASLFCGRFLSVLLVTTALTSALAVTAAEGVVANAVLQEEAAFRAEGGYLYSIRTASIGPDPATLPRRDCERLNKVSLVVAAGSVGESNPITLVRAPDQQIGLRGASLGMLQVIRSLDHQRSVSLDQVIATPAAAVGWGLSEGRFIQIPVLGLRQLALADLDALGPGYAQTLIDFVPATGSAPECLAALRPKAVEQEEVLPVVFAGTEVTVERVLRGAELVAPAAEEYSRRSVRHGWWVIAAIYAVVSLAAIWIKRSDVALYRALGVPAINIRLISATELVSASLIGGLTGVVVGSAYNLDRWGPIIATPAWWSGVATVAALAAAGILAALIAPHPTPMHGLKDR